MTIKKKPSAAEMLTRQLNSTKRKPDTIEDEFALAVACRLEQRNIAKVAGVPADEPEPEWYDLMIEHDRRMKGAAAQREAQRLAEQAAAQPTPGIVASAIRQNPSGRSSSPAMPLNGSRVLTAALAGGNGSVNGHVRDSVAGLIRQSLMASIQDGRNE